MPLAGETALIEGSPTSIAGVSRRRFLIGASAVAAAPLLARLGLAVVDRDDRIDFDSLGLPRLSIGYVEGSETYAVATAGGPARTEHFAGARLVPAAAARRGDSALAGGLVKVTIHGLYPSRLALPPTAQAVAVNGLFASHEPDAPYPFYAWTLRADDAESMSHRSTFRVALDRNPRFGVLIETVTTDGVATAATVFGTGSGTHFAKVRAGTYLLAVGHDGWNRSRILPAAGDWAWDRLPSIVLTVEPIAR